MNIGEHYILTQSYAYDSVFAGEVVEITGFDGDGWIDCQTIEDLVFYNQLSVRSQDLVKAHQIYENGELKWVGPHYIMPCERGDSIEEKTYERPSDFKIDDGVVIFRETSTTTGAIDSNDFTDKKEWEGVLASFRIRIGDQVDITCFGNSKVRGEVIGIVDKRFEVEFRGCKGLFYLNELVKI